MTKFRVINIYISLCISWFDLKIQTFIRCFLILVVFKKVLHNFSFGNASKIWNEKSNTHGCIYNFSDIKLQHTTYLCYLMIFPGKHWRCLLSGNRSSRLPLPREDLIHHYQTYCWSEMIFHNFRIPKIVFLEL